jgi:AcrR family transcriptional regulator
MTIAHLSSAKTDPRIERTRAALLGAFNRLFLARGYDAISPATIAATAGVSRSTFYEHFAGKAALFRFALQPVMQPLADATGSAPVHARLEAVLAHFWDQRAFARLVMSGRPRVVMEGRLAELIESNLRRERYAAVLPLPMAAIHIAHGQLAMIEVWLGGRHRCDVATLARAIQATTSATVDALRADAVGGRQRVQGAASSAARP